MVLTKQAVVSQGADKIEAAHISIDLRTERVTSKKARVKLSVDKL